MNNTISLKMSWQSTLTPILTILESGNAEGRQFAMDELKRMAWLADHAFSPLEITIFPMNEDTLAENIKDIQYYDVMVRPEGSDPIEEYEYLTYDEAWEKAKDLMDRYPQASFEDLTDII